MIDGLQTLYVAATHPRIEAVAKAIPTVKLVRSTHKLLIAEESLRQSQKMEAIGQLTSGVAHDFNNLLTIIRSASEFLQRDGLSDERRQQYVGAIVQTSERAARLTAQLVAFARRSPLKANYST